MGEYEPNDSRNVTGTAQTQDGRWTAQGQQPPNAEGQMDQGQQGRSQQAGQSAEEAYAAGRSQQAGSSGIADQMDQGGQSVGQSGEGVSGTQNQSNDHTSGIGQEQQLDQSGMDENATGQAGQTGWSTGNAAGQVRHGQSVVDSSGQHVGTVDHVDGDRIKLARKDSPDGQHHYLSASQIESCEGDEVRLNVSADQLSG